MTMHYIAIGKLSDLTGCKVTTIRFYEQEGLLHPAFRSEGNQRRYDKSHTARLRFILHARELGFTLSDTRELIRLSGNEVNDHDADEIAVRQLESVERKINRLNSLRSELMGMLATCRAGKGVQCHVIEVLSDHALCSSEQH